ncbi:hypothetical protein KBD81_02020 [Candidatus Woesebacteria bacterium]|nr:hypothetical protein [Candidatus Woesebacteria bacterium]
MAQFIFDSFRSDWDQGVLDFTYSIKRDLEEFRFTERIKLPARPLVSYNPGTLKSVLEAVHIVLGVSYWKLFCPEELVLSNMTLSPAQAAYWKTVYTKGLGEFFYQNSIDFKELLTFPAVEQELKTPAPSQEYKKLLVGVGGGKDSAVSVELLKQHNVAIEGFVLQTQKPYPIVDAMLQVSEIPSLACTRIVDPALFTLNKRDDVLNGHVPISAVYAWLGILSAVLYGFDGFITSNERSANVGNIEYLGTEINHQWSKSREFELITQEYLKNFVSPSLQYVSLLRPLSEYSIVERFVTYPNYFHVFSSCNRNFSLTHIPDHKWCGSCPKCAFVFAVLGAHISRDVLLDIFGANMFDNHDLVMTYRALLGLEGMKPFECVGTPDEVKLAFFEIHKKGEFEDTPMMKMFVSEVLPHEDFDQIRREVTRIDEDILPSQFSEML